MVIGMGMRMFVNVDVDVCWWVGRAILPIFNGCE